MVFWCSIRSLGLDECLVLFSRCNRAFVDHSVMRVSMLCVVQVAVLDIDICGPSIPKLMGCEGEQVHQSGSGWSPVVSPLIRVN